MKPTPIRVIDGSTVRTLLPYAECIDVVRAAMIATSERRVLLPLRQGMPLPTGHGVLGMMPGYLAEPPCFGIKLVSLFPGNTARGLSSHLGTYLLYRAEDGLPLALMNASELTAIRTAAASAVATLALMRPQSRTLAILGTGEQALAHAEALMAAAPFARIHLWGRNAEHVAQLSSCIAERHPVTVQCFASVRDCIADVDVACTVTAAREPIVEGAWLPPGLHLNLVGSSFPTHREVDDAAVQCSRFFVDYRESTLAQAGEFLHALRSGAIVESHIVGEIGQVLNGSIAGRRDADEITTYKSLGIAAQDLAAAWHVYQAAVDRGLGTEAQL